MGNNYTETEDNIESAAYNSEESNEDVKEAVKNVIDDITDADDGNAENTWLKEIIDWVKIIVLAVVGAFLINNFLIINAVIPSASMETTIMTGDRVFGNRLAYINSEPKYGDIVIFKYPDDESQYFIKRVIGTPGDKVEVIDGVVYINDEQIQEDFLSVTPTGNFGPYDVPADCYFMMGDNRDNSADSRYWINTYVHKDKILGKAIFRYFPNPGIVK